MENNQTTKNIAETLASELPKPVEIASRDYDHLTRVALPPNWTVKDFDDEKLLQQPRRKTASIETDTVESFVAYLTLHASEQTTVWVKADYVKGEVDFLGVVNDHGAEDDDRDWRDHRVKFAPGNPKSGTGGKPRTGSHSARPNSRRSSRTTLLTSMETSTPRPAPTCCAWRSISRRSRICASRLPAAFAALVLRKKFVLKIVGDYAWEQAAQRSGYQGTLEEFQTASVGFIPMVFRMLERFVARRATQIVVPSKYLAGIVELWGIDKKRITVIYNGVTIHDVGVKEVIRGVLNFRGRLLISVGRLVPWKGFDVLIKVFAKLKKKFPDLTLFIAGGGPDAERLEGIARKNKVEESIIFAGVVDHDALLRYVKAADVFVLNTSYEGFSHQILETMAVGVPIVTTNVGGNPEIITDGQTGYLIKPNDESALASRITGLLEKHDVYQRITTAARAHVAGFSDAKTVAETATLLKSL